MKGRQHSNKDFGLAKALLRLQHLSPPRRGHPGHWKSAEPPAPDFSTGSSIPLPPKNIRVTLVLPALDSFHWKHVGDRQRSEVQRFQGLRGSRPFGRCELTELLLTGHCCWVSFFFSSTEACLDCLLEHSDSKLSRLCLNFLTSCFWVVSLDFNPVCQYACHPCARALLTFSVSSQC